MEAAEPPKAVRTRRGDKSPSDLSAFGALNQSRSVRYNDKPPATRGAQRDSSEDRIDDVRDQVRRRVDHIDDIVTVDVAEVRIEIELIPKRQWDVRV